MFALGRSALDCELQPLRRVHARAGARPWFGTHTGFTLIELMVVIALIGILSVAIIPEMRGSYDDALLRSTGRQLVNACGLASSRAVSFNQIHRLRLDRRENRFTLERRSPTPGQEFIAVKDLAGSEGELDERINVVLQPDLIDPGSAPQNQESEVAEEPQVPMAPDTISFYPDGTSDRMAIVLKDREGFRLALRLNPVTARVRLVQLPRE